MNISQLECFLSVADHLSFAKAAEELSISQPAASHQIQSLENELGGKLFHRTTRTVTLTEAGREFLDDARRMVAIARTAVQRFENPEERERMPLNMGCPSGLMSALICEGLAKLRDAYEKSESGYPDSIRAFDNDQDRGRGHRRRSVVRGSEL